jgi:uncharacterized protein
MEEILASIRRIIADNGRSEEAEPAAIPPPPAGREPPAAAAGDAPLVLTRALPEGGSVLTVAQGEAGQGEIIAVEEALLLTEPLAPAPPAPPAASAAACASPPPPGAPGAPRWIPVSRSAVPPPVTPPPAKTPMAARSGRTLEEIVREALEPMLHDWLERNLREIVERRVQEEIERISHQSESRPESRPPES